VTAVSAHLPADERTGPQDLTALSGPAAAAGDSISVATWTIVSRATGVAKFAAIGAVLGPTFFGNTYQFTNSLPNLVYYGILAGSLLSSLLVPALVRHIDAGDRKASERVAGGFLGITMLAMCVVAPVAMLLGPLVLRFAAASGSEAVGAAQAHVGRWLIIMFIPQIFFYGIVAAASAVMNARRRFALPAAAPAIENIGIIIVLAATAVLYGGKTHLGDVPTGEMLLLGLGTTCAVALHAAAQWWGAARAGVTLVPRSGWRDPEVMIIVRRSLPAIAQAALAALQVLTLLILANGVAGGVVAFQMALNFYYLAIALGATPVALSLLPRLSRMHLSGDEGLFRDTLAHGFALGLFVTIPAAVGYVVLAEPIAQAISFGKMGSEAGVTMVAVSIAALSVAVVAQTVFMIATYASYARMDVRTPLISMGLQAIVCLGLVGLAELTHGPAMLAVLGLAFSVAIIAGASTLLINLRRQLRRVATTASRPQPDADLVVLVRTSKGTPTEWGRVIAAAPWSGVYDTPGTSSLSRGRPPIGESVTERPSRSLIKVVVGAAVMAAPAWFTAHFIPDLIGGQLGAVIGIAAAALVGAGFFVAVEALWKTPELGWIAGGFGKAGRKARRTTAGVAHE
jgi:putative peptidoglycan lipid II flippase